MNSEMDTALGRLVENQDIKVRHYKKGEILQHKGAKNPKFYVVKKGLLRSYHIDDVGRLHIFGFATSGNCICDPKSIITKQPSELFLDVLEDSIVEIISFNCLDSSVIPSKYQDIVISVLDNCVCDMQNRILKMMSASSFERYQFFTESYPEIACRIPQRMIASYLGITPEALSSIKSRYYRQNRSA